MSFYHLQYYNLLSIMKFLFLILLNFSLLHLGLGQDHFTIPWQPGIIHVESGETYTGEFTIEKLAKSDIIRHLKPDGQNTFSADQVNRLSVWDEDLSDSLIYKRVTFDLGAYLIKPDFLFEVLYESDSFEVFRTDHETLKRFFLIVPLGDLGIIYSFGKRIVRSDVIVMKSSQIGPIVINDPTKKQRQKVMNIDGLLVLDSFLNEHFEELSNYVNDQNLSWQQIDDFIQIVQFYDNLE